jgi:hypothetical protein
MKETLALDTEACAAEKNRGYFVDQWPGLPNRAAGLHIDAP